MRVVIDIYKDKIFKKDVDDRHEIEQIAEVDHQKDCGINIFIKDRKNTIITISEENLFTALNNAGFVVIPEREMDLIKDA